MLYKAPNEALVSLGLDVLYAKLVIATIFGTRKLKLSAFVCP